MLRWLSLVALVVAVVILVFWVAAPEVSEVPPTHRGPADEPEGAPESPPRLPDPRSAEEPPEPPREPWTLEVHVSGADGKPLPTATLTFVHDELLPQAEGETDESGRAELKPLGPGSLLVVHPASGHAPAHRTGLAAEPGGRLPVEVRLEAGLTFTGTVLDHEGNPARARVRLHPPGGSWLADFFLQFRGHTDADGRFRIDRLPPGTYRLVVRPVDPGSGIAPPEIEVRAGGAADVRLLPPLTATLRIVDAATGELVRGSIEVHVTKGGVGRTTLYTNSTGEISLAPPEGAQVVVIAEGHEPTEPFSVRGGPGVVEEVRVTKKRETMGRVTLVLRDTKGKPLTDVRVRRVRLMGDPRASNVVTVTVPLAEAVPEGRVAFELPVGEHELLIQPRTGGTATVVVSVEGGGETVREVDFARLGSLRVSYGAGDRIRIFREATALHPVSRYLEGSLVYSGLEAGPVTVEARLDGVPVTREAEILPGSETEVRFDGGR